MKTSVFLNIKNEQQAVLVCCSYYSDLKTIKSLSDFPHNVVRDDALRALIPEYLFSVCECNLYNCFHVKGKGTQ